MKENTQETRHTAIYCEGCIFGGISIATTSKCPWCGGRLMYVGFTIRELVEIAKERQK